MTYRLELCAGPLWVLLGRYADDADEDWQVVYSAPTLCEALRRGR